MVGGDFLFPVKVTCAPLDPGGVPLEPQGVSVSIEPEAGGASILCIETAVCDTRYEGTVKITATGQRASWVGYAYTGAACQGVASDASAEVAYTYPGMKPKKPSLVE